jgi:Na+-transporting NADH:ubiquinone oxidoreductase subunit NqrC
MKREIPILILCVFCLCLLASAGILLVNIQADAVAADIKHEILRSQDGQRLRRWTDYEMEVVCYQTANSALDCLPLKQPDN